LLLAAAPLQLRAAAKQTAWALALGWLLLLPPCSYT